MSTSQTSSAAARKTVRTKKTELISLNLITKLNLVSIEFLRHWKEEKYLPEK